jgi:hypothetical protein
MADRSSASRWSAAAVLAPTAAALFTGVTAWTLHHSPALPNSSSALKTSSAPATLHLSPPVATGSLSALQSSVRRDAAKLAALRTTLAKLHLASATPSATSPSGLPPARGAAAPATTAVSGGSTYMAAAPPGSPAYVAPQPAAPAPVAQPAPAARPAPVVQPAAAAPPPAHTVTGASGAPK